HFVTGSSVDQHFCHGHRIFVLWRRSVEVSEIHTDSPSAILLLYRDHTGDPFCIPTWPDELCVQHLLHLFLDLLQDFSLHLPCSLLKRLKSFLKREPMFDDASIQTGHFSIIPRKTIPVFLQQRYHRLTQARVLLLADKC